MFYYLVIIFVFDPLAISLVVAANFAFDTSISKKEIQRKFVWGRSRIRF